MKCALCKAPIFGYGHNGQPLTNERVCEVCNDIYVIQARMLQVFKRVDQAMQNRQECALTKKAR
jgi:hypothetical protein